MCQEKRDQAYNQEETCLKFREAKENVKAIFVSPLFCSRKIRFPNKQLGKLVHVVSEAFCCLNTGWTDSETL